MVHGAEHELRDKNYRYLGSEKIDENRTRIFSEPEGGVIQLANHRECLRVLSFPIDHLDQLVGEYPYVQEMN